MQKRFVMVLGVIALLIASSSFAATSIPFTINMSEAVNVTGTPRVAVDVGGVTRYATYTSGTGTSALTFTYTMTAGDVDLDGVTLTSPLQLNGGTIKDLNGNDATLTFSVPNTSNVKVNYPSLGMDFVYDADGRYTLNGTAYNDLPSFLTATGGTFARNSIAAYYDSTGILQTASANTPRFDYDPVTHAPKGILIEESRTNLLLRSSEFDDATWIKSGMSVGANVTTAPDGTTMADKLIESASPATHYVRQNATFIVGNTYTFSVYMKKAERDWALIDADTTGAPGYVYVDLTNGVFGAQTGTLTSKNITSVGNGWFKVSISFVADNTSKNPCIFTILNSSGYSYAGDGTSGIYIWGAQLEQGSFPTSYIPTTTAVVTRAADAFIIPYGTWFTQTNGTWSAEAYNSPNPGNGRIIGVSASSANYLGYGAGSSGTAIETWDGATNRVTSISPAATASAHGKYAMSWSNTSMLRSIVANNSAVANGAIGAAYSGTSFAVGSNNTGNNINSDIRKIKYYPARVTDTQLQLMTQ